MSQVALAMEHRADEPGDQSRKRSSLPPELAFLNELADLAKLEPETMITWAREFVRKVREKRELIRRHGLDPDLLIRDVQKPLEALEKAAAKLEATQESHLQAMADKADSMRNLVDGLERLVQRRSEEQPFDPEVQEMQDLLKELRKVYPKIN